MSELANCPFCGKSENEAGRRLLRVIIGGIEMVECRGCGTLTRETSWNRRATPPIGTRYRNTDNEVVAVVAPRILPREVFEEASVGFKGADYHGELGRWLLLHDFLPEPD